MITRGYRRAEPGTQVDPSCERRLQQQLGQTRQNLEKLVKSGAKQQSRTDPDSRFLHQAQGFVLGYTVDLAVSDDHLIVAQRTTQAPSDNESLLPMVDRVMETCGEWPAEVGADSAFFSVDNVMGMETRGGQGLRTRRSLERGVAASPQASEDAWGQSGTLPHADAAAQPQGKDSLPAASGNGRTGDRSAGRATRHEPGETARAERSGRGNRPRLHGL